MILTTAPIDILFCPTTLIYTSVARTLKFPPTTFGAPKSVNESMNAIIKEDIIPYFIFGRVIVKNFLKLLVPSISAAS